MARPIKMTNI